MYLISEYLVENSQPKKKKLFSRRKVFFTQNSNSQYSILIPVLRIEKNGHTRQGTCPNKEQRTGPSILGGAVFNKWLKEQTQQVPIAVLSQVVCIFSSFPIQITTQRHYRTAQLMSQKQPSCAAGDSQLVSQKQPSCAAGDSQLMSQKQPSCTAGNSQLIRQNVRPVQRETHS